MIEQYHAYSAISAVCITYHVIVILSRPFPCDFHCFMLVQDHLCHFSTTNFIVKSWFYLLTCTTYRSKLTRNSHAYGTYLPSFQSSFLENMGVVLYNKGYQMRELFILLQLIQVLTPISNLINVYEDQNEVGVRTSISHQWGMIRNFKLKIEEKHVESQYYLMNINTERK